MSHLATVCANIVNCGIDQAVKVTIRLDALQELRDNETYSPGKASTILGLSQATADYYAERGPALEVPDYRQWPELRPAVPGFAIEGKAAMGEALIRIAWCCWDKELEKVAASLMEWDASPKKAYTVGVEMELQLPFCDNNGRYRDPEPTDPRECVRCANIHEGNRVLAGACTTPVGSSGTPTGTAWTRSSKTEPSSWPRRPG